MKLRNLAAAVFACLALACPARAATLLPNGQQCFSATVGLNGMVGTLGTITGGSAYTAGTYGGVALTGGSGTGATATITVAAGAVTGVAILAPGKNYVTGDVLSAAAASIGGTGSGFSVPVASVAVNSALAAGTLNMFVPNTTTPKATWKDAAQTQLNTQPIVLDANGCAVIYGSGTYRQQLFDALGNLIWDQVTADYSATNSPYWAGLAGGTPNAITLVDPNFNGTDGQSIAFIALGTNTGPTTANASGFGLIPIQKDTSTGPVNLAGGEITAGNVAYLVYDATNLVFHLLNTQQVTAAGITFTQAGVGAVTRPLSTWAQGEPIHAKDFLVAGQPDGTTDNTVALQNWLNQCVAVSATCYLDAGTYKITAALTISGAIRVTGAGRNSSIIQLASATQNGIVINTLANFGQIDQIAIFGAVGVSAGNLIQVTAPSSFNQFWTFSDIQLHQSFVSLNFINATAFIIDRAFIDCTVVCVASTLAGDAVISNSTITPQGGTAVVLTSTSSGGASGFRFLGNKINSATAGSVGFILTANACTTCSDFLIVGNSIETIATGIQITKGTGTSYVNVNIVGNEINANNPIALNDPGVFLGSVAISGNVIAPITGIGVNIAAASNFSVVGNTITAAGAATAGVNIAAAAANGLVANNQYSSGFTAKLANLSTTTILDEAQGFAFASLPAAAANGSRIFITDGAPASTPCTGGSTGSTAFRQNGAWKCF